MSAGFAQAFSAKAGKWFPGESGRSARIIAGAIIGGTSSKLGGGKFANGAVSGAFSRLFNDLKVSSEFNDDIDKIRKDPFGKTVLEDIESSPIKYEIVAKKYAWIAKLFGISPSSGYSPQTRKIYMDAGMSSNVVTSKGPMVVDSTGTLFHETGHMHRDHLGILIRNNRAAEEMETIRTYENPFTGFDRINHSGSGNWP